MRSSSNSIAKFSSAAAHQLVRLFPALTSAFALALTSCVSPPPPSTTNLGLTFPPRWESESAVESPSLDEWWTEFSAPSLNSAVSKALTANPDLVIAAERLSAAAAQSRIDGADLFPSVNVTSGGAKQRQNFVGLPIPGGSGVLVSRSRSFNLNLAASWELDLWGRVRSGKKAAIATLQASAADLEAARQSIAGQTAKAWIQAVASGRQWQLAEDTAANYEDTAEKVRSRYERGTRSSLDLRLAINSASAARAQALNWSTQHKRAARVLKTLLGDYPTSAFPLEDLPELSQSPPGLLPADLLERRPDLAAAERRVAAAAQRYKQARASLLPRVSLTASGGRVSNEISDLLDHNFSVWSLAGNLAQPVFQGGRLIAGVDLSAAREREAAAAYVKTALQAFAEVESALSDDGELKELENERLEAERQSAAALALAEQRYERGLSEFIAVLESQRRAFNDASMVIQARQRRLENRIDLHLALGGGFHSASLAPDQLVGN